MGIGTSTPYSQLANTSVNIIGADGAGGGTGSLAWAATQEAFAAQVFNGGSTANSNGMVVKVNSTSAVALDVSRGQQGDSGTPLLTVKSIGRVGINNNNPLEALDITGNIKYSGNLQMGIQYQFGDADFPANFYGYAAVGCPAGTKLIGGGGQRDINASQSNFFITYSGPDKNDTNNWLLLVKNSNSESIPIRVYTICAKVQ